MVATMICSACRNHNPVFSSFIDQRFCSK